MARRAPRSAAPKSETFAERLARVSKETEHVLALGPKTGPTAAVGLGVRSEVKEAMKGSSKAVLDKLKSLEAERDKAMSDIADAVDAATKAAEDAALVDKTAALAAVGADKDAAETGRVEAETKQAEAEAKIADAEADRDDARANAETVKLEAERLNREAATNSAAAAIDKAAAEAIQKDAEAKLTAAEAEKVKAEKLRNEAVAAKDVSETVAKTANTDKLEAERLNREAVNHRTAAETAGKAAIDSAKIAETDKLEAEKLKREAASDKAAAEANKVEAEKLRIEPVAAKIAAEAAAAKKFEALQAELKKVTEEKNDQQTHAEDLLAEKAGFGEEKALLERRIMALEKSQAATESDVLKADSAKLSQAGKDLVEAKRKNVELERANGKLEEVKVGLKDRLTELEGVEKERAELAKALGANKNEHAVELARLEAVNVENTALKQNRTKGARELASLRARIEKLQLENGGSLEAKKQAESALEAAEKLSDELVTKHAKELADETDSHETELAELRGIHQGGMDRLLDDHREELVIAEAETAAAKEESKKSREYYSDQYMKLKRKATEMVNDARTQAAESHKELTAVQKQNKSLTDQIAQMKAEGEAEEIEDDEEEADELPPLFGGYDDSERELSFMKDYGEEDVEEDAPAATPPGKRPPMGKARVTKLPGGLMSSPEIDAINARYAAVNKLGASRKIIPKQEILDAGIKVPDNMIKFATMADSSLWGKDKDGYRYKYDHNSDEWKLQ